MSSYDQVLARPGGGRALAVPRLKRAIHRSYAGGQVVSVNECLGGGASVGRADGLGDSADVRSRDVLGLLGSCAPGEGGEAGDGRRAAPYPS